jgi:hypothetical protein
MPNGAKGGLNRIARSYALPVLRWKVEESHQLITIFEQA